MNSNTPTQDEQRAVEWYVLKRPLYRPNTSYKKAILYILAFCISDALLTGISYFMLSIFADSDYAPEWFCELYCNHHQLFILLLVLIVFVICGAVVSKHAVIGAIHLYQRYAPEDVRRRCLLKPTCSEYAILAIDKHGVIVGAYKTIKRLFITCSGSFYRIDEP